MSPSGATGGSRGRPDTTRRRPRAGIVYGVGALAAAVRGDRVIWALHRAALERGLIPVVPAPVVAEAARAAEDATQLDAFLAGVEVEALDADAAARLGRLAAEGGSDNLVTAALVEAAARRNLAAVGERAPRLAELAKAASHELVLHVP